MTDESKDRLVFETAAEAAHSGIVAEPWDFLKYNENWSWAIPRPPPFVYTLF